MAIRLLLIMSAMCLALIGCKHRVAGHAGEPVLRGKRTSNVAPSRPPVVLSATPRVYAGTLGAAGAPYTLDSGDKLRITVFGQENLSRTYPVDASGYISMPLIGAVLARGATSFQLEERIADTLKRKYVKDPKVTVSIDVNRPFFILGEVRNAGQYPYVADMTVQTAVAIAGGFTARAKKRAVQLTRRVHGASVSRSVPMNWKMQPGDTITVKERFF